VTHAGPEPNWRDPRQVFLTGATGSRGAHLLRELLDRTDARIHTRVRGRDDAHAYGQLAEAQRRYGIHRPLPEHRVCPVLGDLTKPGLGMRKAAWEREAAPAVEEILRYTSVFQHVTRTVLRPQNTSRHRLVPRRPALRLGGVSQPRRRSLHGAGHVRIDRDPNPHLAFTAGKHFCLIIAFASVPGGTTGWLIQAKGRSIQLRPTGRDELTE